MLRLGPFSIAERIHQRRNEIYLIEDEVLAAIAELTAERDGLFDMLRREQAFRQQEFQSLHLIIGDAKAEAANLQRELSAARQLLIDSRSKFDELYVTLATEDLSIHDLRELRTLADQGGLAIDFALAEKGEERG
jgi:hypothetical protein